MAASNSKQPAAVVSGGFTQMTPDTRWSSSLHREPLEQTTRPVVSICVELFDLHCGNPIRPAAGSQRVDTVMQLGCEAYFSFQEATDVNSHTITVSCQCIAIPLVSKVKGPLWAYWRSTWSDADRQKRGVLLLSSQCVSRSKLAPQTPSPFPSSHLKCEKI